MTLTLDSNWITAEHPKALLKRSHIITNHADSTSRKIQLCFMLLSQHYKVISTREVAFKSSLMPN